MGRTELNQCYTDVEKKVFIQYVVVYVCTYMFVSKST